MGKKRKVSFYIDGFNIYHRINEYYHKTGKCYKWLNYKSLCNSLLKDKETLADIYLFTGEIWEASLLYSQVEKEFKYDRLGEIAKYKNAKISFELNSGPR